MKTPLPYFMLFEYIYSGYRTQPDTKISKTEHYDTCVVLKCVPSRAILFAKRIFIKKIFKN